MAQNHYMAGICHLTHSLYVAYQPHNACITNRVNTYKQVIYDAIFAQMSPGGVVVLCAWLAGTEYTVPIMIIAFIELSGGK